MALSVKKAVLWRREIENRPGTLAESLKPFSKAGVNLQIVMGYTSPSRAGSSALEVFPIADAKAEQVAKEAGLHAGHEVHCLVVEGDDRSGVAYDIANAMASAGINLQFAMCQALNKKFQAVFGFGSDKDAEKASGLISKL
jgi:hypothetical protein